MAFERDIEHYSRHLPWGGASGDGDIVLFGVDYSSATFVMTIADEPGGTTKFTLDNQTAGTQGVSAILEDPYTHPVTGEEDIATVVTLQIDEETFEGLSDWATPPEPLTFYYDLLATPSGAPQEAVCFGTFTIYPGVGD
tara:strand:- start:45 stop:461 length:417 start_codon:yes stop_codon:yes gene_type:complete